MNLSIHKYVGSCNGIDDPHDRVYVLYKVKNMKVFNPTPWVNETKFLVHHKSCECKCGFDESGCSSKQKWNQDKCRCECKGLYDWSSSKDNQLWNISTCNYKCKKACKIDKYLDTKSCLFEKRLFDKLV